MKIKYISLLRTLIGTPTLCVGHHSGDARQLFNKSHIVASCYHTFPVYINDILPHHLTGTYIT